MSLNIKYSLDLEKQRVRNTLKKLLWYEKLGYAPRFPKNVNPNIDNLEKIYIALQNEYIEEDYKIYAIKIKKEFSKIEADFFKKLQKVCGKKIKKNFNLILTKYGVGGSYALPNKIIYNMAMQSSSANTILHEILHLIIEPYIKKCRIQQNAKERIVDLILMSEPIALYNYKMQKRGQDHKKLIDPLFKKHFKTPINNFFKELAELSDKKP